MNFRYALRLLWKTPGVTLIAVLTLALGIGINSVVFALYESAVWKPLAVRSPEQVVRVYGSLAHGQTVDSFSYAEYAQMRRQNQSFAAMVATSTPQSMLYLPPRGKPEEAEVAQARLVSENYFPALGVAFAAGRPFDGSEAAVVVSHSFWQRRLNADPGAVGQSISIQGVPLTILGVAAQDFLGTGLPPRTPDFWIPLIMQSRVLPNVDWLHDEASRPLQILARRKPDVPLQRALAELSALGAGLPPVENQAIQLKAKPATFFQADSGEFETFLTISRLLMAAVALVLLIGCVNLVHLLMARAAARERELAVRRALGAGRMQLIRQLATESLVLGLLGGAAALLISMWATAWIGTSLIEIMQRISGGLLAVTLDVTPDWRTFAYTALLSVFTGAAVGVWPAVRASKADIQRALKGDATLQRRTAPGWSRRNLLLTAQVAACLILLSCAGLLFRGVWRSREADPGFDARRMFLMGVETRAVAATPAAQAALLRRVTGRLSEMPEIASIAEADRPPFLGHGSSEFQNDRRQDVQCLFNRVTDRYFETMGIPVLAGRTFTEAEAQAEAPVALISESAAKAMWPGQDALGRRVFAYEPVRLQLKHESYTVIGVVKSVRSTYLSKIDSPFLYFPRAAATRFGVYLVRTRTRPEAALRRTMALLAGIHPNLPSQSTLLTVEQGPVQVQRLMAGAPAVVASALGILALLLAALGIYGTVSYLVTHRTREIGIRLAMGARAGDVVGMVLREGLTSVAWGGAIGLTGALGISTLLAKVMVMPDIPDLTYGAGAFDPATFGGSLGVLTATVLLASFLPVKRATRVDPAIALRDE